MTTVVQRRAHLAASLQRRLSSEYIVVASPDHPLVLRSVDILIGGRSGLTAIMMLTAEEVRRPRLFVARSTLNRMALAPETTFIYLSGDHSLPEAINLLFDRVMPLGDNDTMAELGSFVRTRRVGQVSASFSKLHRLAQPRFANTYRLAKMLKHRAENLEPRERRVTSRMPARDRLSSDVEGAYFDGAPSPALLSAFTTAEYDRWFGADNGEVFLNDTPAGLAFVSSLPEFPGDPDKGLRAAAFAGWVVTQPNAPPENVTHLVSRRSRHKLMQALVRASAAYYTEPRCKEVESELEELGNCTRTQPLKRQRLLQVIHAGRSIDTCLSIILAANGVSAGHGIGGKLNQLKSLHPSTRGYLDHATATAFRISIADKRNRYAHNAGAFPTSTNEVDTFVSEVHACLSMVL